MFCLGATYKCKDLESVVACVVALKVWFENDGEFACSGFVYNTLEERFFCRKSKKR